ncbi:valine--tRNA ligase [Candidatus Azambacteria bacterium]|nr:valine--tRNA ligase [Candidatus Azambacteria bacterium]
MNTKNPKNIPTVYEPKKVEDKIYKIWEKSGYFNPDKLPNKKTRKKSFSIMMPPPNATGVLHIGHTLMLAIQDAEVRFHRMRGEKALWIPGTDHASIATQNVVEKLLLKEGKTKEDLGRKAFLKEVDKFVKNSKNTIKTQIKKMGSSCDWSREAYTLDKNLSEAVQTVFIKMYNDGLIYKGFRMVNWCPRCVSTLADDEVNHKEKDGNLYYIKYPIKDGGFFFFFTTRPETMLGDTALVVNPKDERYLDFIGRTSVMPLTQREIPVLADSYVETGFGTGVLKVTPGHDFNDFNLGKKHKLDVIDIFDERAKIDAKSAEYHNFKDYAGLDRFEARKKIINDLQKEGFLVKIEPHKHNVGHCYRCDSVMEPKVSSQWFVDVNKKIKGGRSLKQKAIEAVKSGKIEIIPKRFDKTYFHWMNNLNDWCISRQIWFGHKIPAYYCGDCSEIMVQAKKPAHCKKCRSKKIRAEGDTLDTWFSSGLWTFSTLGWPKKTKDLKEFHPTSLMETGYDIIFFWVARMIIMSEYALGEVPFKKVYLHGLVRDEKGVKMSKSIGNVIDPLVVSEKYGADATRLSLIIGNSPGNDLKLSEEKIASFRNFSNKIWNVSRYAILNSKPTNVKDLTIPDKWILSKLNTLIKEITAHYEKIELSLAGEKLREFIWSDLADWYIETAKTQKSDVLKDILKNILVLAHPLLPFLTEHIWEVAGFKKDPKNLLIVESWPKETNIKNGKSVEKDFALIKDTIVAVRNLRAEYKVEPNKKITAIIYSKEEKILNSAKPAILFLAGLSDAIIEKSGQKPENSAEAIIKKISVYIPIGDLMDKEKELERIRKELAGAIEYRAVIQRKLENENFIKRAPEKIVNEEKKKLEEQNDLIKILEEKLRLF